VGLFFFLQPPHPREGGQAGKADKPPLALSKGGM